MAYDEGLAERIRALLEDERGVTEKKMFGGVAFLLDGKMFVGIVKHDLMVRVGPDRYQESLRRRHARPMDFTSRRRAFPRTPSWRSGSGSARSSRAP